MTIKPHKTIPRILDLESTLKRKSVFLLGPRQTGKSTFLKQQILAKRYPDAKFYSLLLNDVFLSLNKDPGRLRREITAKDKLVIIDEIQKLPLLLDEVHWLIEEYGTRFILTGSSARKLKKAGTNLLGGRATQWTLHPFCSEEIGDFDLQRALSYGLIPSIWFSPEPEQDLKDYTGTYLKEEIAAEGLTRNLPAFSRFLEVAALSNGQMINYTSIANDAQVSKTTCYEYFQILVDTLLGHEVPSWQLSRKRKAISTGKFYFFDIGVARSLQGQSKVMAGTPDFGAAFEAYVFHELKTYTDYHRLQDVHYWRSKSNFEVDFIFNGQVAIEVKAKKNIAGSDLKGLRALREEGLLKKYLVVSLETRAQKIDGIDILPWRIFLKMLWAGEFDASI